MSSDQLTRRLALTDPAARLERMMEIRRFEDRIQELFAEGLVHGSTHLCQGQEAVGVGIAAATRPTDTVTCTYRGHGVALGLGMTPRSVLGEIMGRTSGCVGGVGGSMHLCDTSVGLLPTFAIVGAGIPVAAGAALTAQVNGTDDIAVAVFGDGSTNIGAFHEAMNLAWMWQLPVLFVCENNQFGEYSHITTTTAVADLVDRAPGYGVPAQIVDGMDIDAVVATVQAAADRARDGGGPQMIEAKTYRYAGHSRSDQAGYRDPEEMARWQSRDPINMYASRLVEANEVSASEVESLRADVHEMIEQTVEAVSNDPEPGLDAMFAHVLA